MLAPPQVSSFPDQASAKTISTASTFAAVTVDPEGNILWSDHQADALFGVPLSPGQGLQDVLVGSEKLGILATGGAAGIIAACYSSHDYLFQMRDGRSFLLRSSGGGTKEIIVRFTDVTFVVQTTLSNQRDALTGLPNRSEVIRRTDEHLISNHTQCQGALLILDLDRFTRVNDTLGHLIGDALLKLVADRVLKVLGPSDILARRGSDEFIILQRDPDQPKASEILAKRLIDLVGRTYLIQGHSVQVGASVGIALPLTDGNTAEEVMKNADLALFKAKSAGGSAFSFFTKAMHMEMQKRRALEIDIQRALVLDQFHLVYQPQFQIGTGQIVGFEALLRWSTPERGNVSPGDFIPVAEEIGLMDRLGEWVLRRACEDASTWPSPLSVSVNVSPVQFKNPSLMETVLSAMELAGLEPHRLDLEITEGALMDDTNATVSTLTQLKAIGIKTSMDDFGTGYSSLSYLQKFPFDKIKIDQSFIRNMETSEDSASIVRAVTALGSSLGMITIAEGVETENQLSQIAQSGCNQVQGYLTGRPMPPLEARNLAQMRKEEIHA